MLDPSRRGCCVALQWMSPTRTSHLLFVEVNWYCSRRKCIIINKMFMTLTSARDSIKCLALVNMSACCRRFPFLHKVTALQTLHVKLNHCPTSSELLPRLCSLRSCLSRVWFIFWIFCLLIFFIYLLFFFCKAHRSKATIRDLLSIKTRDVDELSKVELVHNWNRLSISIPNAAQTLRSNSCIKYSTWFINSGRFLTH